MFYTKRTYEGRFSCLVLLTKCQWFVYNKIITEIFYNDRCTRIYIYIYILLSTYTSLTNCDGPNYCDNYCDGPN